MLEASWYLTCKAQKQTGRPMYQNRRPRHSPRIYSQLIFHEGAQNTWWRKERLFNKCCWESWISTYRRLKLDPCLSPCNKVNLKWIQDLNIRPETETNPGSSRKYTGTDRYREWLPKQNSKDSASKKSNEQKGNSHQTQETAHRIRENLCQLLIWLGTNIQNLQLTQKLSPQRINTPVKK
jgi:hypothetical protein